MKKILKRVALSFLAVMTVICLGACGSGTAQSDQETVTEETTQDVSVEETVENEPSEEELENILIPNINEYHRRIDEMEDQELASKYSLVAKKVIWCYLNGKEDMIYDMIENDFADDTDAVGNFMNDEPLLEVYGEAVAALSEEKRDAIMQIGTKLKEDEPKLSPYIDATILYYAGEVVLGKAGNQEEINNLDDFKNCFGDYYYFGYHQYLINEPIDSDVDYSLLDSALEQTYEILMN